LSNNNNLFWLCTHVNQMQKTGFEAASFSRARRANYGGDGLGGQVNGLELGVMKREVSDRVDSRKGQEFWLGHVNQDTRAF
jgi:hypothetical protein